LEEERNVAGEIRATPPVKSRRREAGRINHVRAANKGENHEPESTVPPPNPEPSQPTSELSKNAKKKLARQQRWKAKKAEKESGGEGAEEEGNRTETKGMGRKYCGDNGGRESEGD